MLNSQSRIRQPTSVASTKGIYPLYEQTLDSPSSPFPSIENNDNRNKEEEPTKGEKSQDGQQDDIMALSQYTPDSDFQELVNTFLVVGHKKLMILRSKMRHEHMNQSHSLPAVRNKQKCQQFREQCYKVRMIVFNLSKGSKFDLLL